MKTKAHTSIRQFGLLTAACLLAISAQSASAITFVQWPSSAGATIISTASLIARRTVLISKWRG